MHIYSMIQWLFIFYTYCFLGWCFESANVSIRSRQFINRGFIRGPFLPLYGSGATMMYIVSLPFQDNVILTYIAGCIGATALEFVVGVIMDTLFDVRYWDYSKRKFNYKGHICLRSTIVWGFLTIFMTKVIHQPIEAFMLSIPPNILGYVTFILTIYIAGDFALSFKAALDLRDVLAKMQRVKEEMERMQRRLDVIIAINNEEKEQKRQVRELKMDELADSLAQRFSSIKETIQNKPGAYVSNVLDEIAELRARYNLYMENRKNYKEMLDFYERDMIINNPDMVSSKFKVTFEELKNVVMEKIGR
ncbi:MAG: hypothetical protein J1E98_01925 [Lachnospiraceae bacterium]|nr:hypothetical protein [Lachnospiraceae bacterium]